MLDYDFNKIALVKRLQEDFEDFGVIGSGGFATVHRVKNRLSGRFYALKISKIKPSECKNTVEDHLYRMLAEVKTLSSLRHPNILRYYHGWIEATEYLPGEMVVVPNVPIEESTDFEMIINNEDSQDNIGFQFAREEPEESIQIKTNQREKQRNEFHQNKIDERGKFHEDGLKSFKEIRIMILTELAECSLQSYVYQRNAGAKLNGSRLDSKGLLRNYQIINDIVNGLQYLHSRKVVHRDIKLQNIVMDASGKCKIIDFGLAKKIRMHNSTYFEKQNEPETNEQISETLCQSVGTKIFSSPEQATSEKYDQRTDVYSVGLVIIIIFSTFTTAHEERELLYEIRNKNLSKIEIPAPLKEILLKCLGEEKTRPSLDEIKKCVKELSYHELMKNNQISIRSELILKEPIEEQSNPDKSVDLPNRRKISIHRANNSHKCDQCEPEKNNENEFIEMNLQKSSKSSPLRGAFVSQNSVKTMLKLSTVVRRGRYNYCLQGRRLMKRIQSEPISA